MISYYEKNAQETSETTGNKLGDKITIKYTNMIAWKFKTRVVNVKLFYQWTKNFVGSFQPEYKYLRKVMMKQKLAPIPLSLYPKEKPYKPSYSELMVEFERG